MNKPDYLDDVARLRKQVDRLYEEIENGYLDGHETFMNIIEASELLDETLEEIAEIRESQREDEERERWEDCWHNYKDR